MEMTFATFNMSENFPVVKERLTISAKSSDTLLFTSLIIFVGILFGLAELQLFSKENSLEISSPVERAVMND